MPFIRSRDFALDGQHVKLGSILDFEAEALFTRQRELLDDKNIESKAKLAGLDEMWAEFVAQGLNRGKTLGPDGQVDWVWTPKNLKEEFDKGFLTAIRNALMDMNGIGLVKGEVTAP